MQIRGYIKEYLTQYIQQFEQMDVAVSAVILFGSHARGEGMVSSDVDLAMVLRSPLTRREQGLLRSLGDDIDERIDTNLFFTTPEALEMAHSDLDTNSHIKKEGIVIWEESLT